MTLLIRCDATVMMGTGHAMRCLALAQAWQDEGGQAVFVMADSTPAVEQRLREQGAEVMSLQAAAGSEDDAIQTAKLATERRAKWVVVDGYQFGAEYQQQIKNTGHKLLFVDDNGHAAHYCADLVLNQNVHAAEALYASREPDARLLLGPRYALLRREFARRSRAQRAIPPVARRLLVSMGGSDPHNVALKVLRAIVKLPPSALKVTVVAGGSNPHRASLEAAVAESAVEMQLVHNVTDMAELLAEADLAVLSASVTCLEACCLALPAVLIELAPNQHAQGQRMDALGAARFLGLADNVTEAQVAEALELFISDHARRQAMSDKASSLVDGQGAARVAALMQDRMHLRRVAPSDCRMLFEWANDPEVRAASFSSAAITWEEHEKWFNARLADPESLLYIAEEEGAPAGQVRFEGVRNRAQLSISVSVAARGRGRGRRMLLLAAEELFHSTRVEAIDAFVKPENARSLELFDKAGFQRLETATVKGQPAIHFVLYKNVTA